MRWNGGGRSRMRTGLCIENPCFATRTAKSRGRLADPTDEKRSWQRGFEATTASRSDANNREFARAYQGIRRRKTGPPQKGVMNATRVFIPLAENAMRMAYSANG